MGTLKINKKEKTTEIEIKNVTNEGKVEKSVQNFLAEQDGEYVEEYKHKRSENSATYRRNNRTLRKIVYSSPVFYRDEKSGEFAEIKNNLSESGDEIVNESNFYKVKFDKLRRGGKLYDVVKGKNTVSLFADVPKERICHDENCGCVLCKSDNSVTFSNVNGAEIKYMAFNDSIKEDIIVKEKQNEYIYNFTLNIGDMTVEEGEKCDLLLKDADTGEVEFRIPAPYMYDAAGVRSNEVEYEIDVNGSELAIKVIASADFINADERKFPVIIDPQIIMQGSDYMTFTSINHYDYDEGVAYSHGFLNIEISCGTPEDYTNAKIDLKEPISFTRPEGKVSDVYLRLHSYEGGGAFICNGELYEAQNNKFYEIPLEEGQTTIFLNGVANNKYYSSGVLFDTTGEYAPKLVYEFVEDEKEQLAKCEKPNVKKFLLGNRVEGYFNLNDSVLTSTFNALSLTDLTIPMNIAYVHKLGNDDNCFGTNWRLSLSKKLKKSGNDTEKTTQFVYIDELGDHYNFYEYYYYLDNGKAVFIDKDVITIEYDGSLKYYGREVFKQQFCCGYTLIPKIDDYINSKFIEQRQSNYKELEEYLNSLKSSLLDFVTYNTNDHKVYKSINNISKDNYESLINGINETSSSIILSSGEAVQLQNLQLNVNKVDNELTDEQKNAIKAQINNIIKLARNNLSQIKNSFKNYFEKEYEFNLLKKQTPVNYLKDQNGLISGFNEAGDFVCIFDSFGNYVDINYDISNHINELCDNKGNTVKFKYESSYLQSITDNRGRKFICSYNDKKALQDVTFSDGNMLTFKYKDLNFRTIESSEGYVAKFNCSGNKISYITNTAAVPKTNNINEIYFTYHEDGLTISVDGGITESYVFDKNRKIKTYTALENNKVSETTEYTYESTFGGRKVTAVTTSNVDKNASTVIDIYNDMDLLTSRTLDWYNISDTVKVKTVALYEYDRDHKTVKAVQNEFTDKSGDITQKTAVTKYLYNSNGFLTLSESYVEGEEETEGISYEENIYDDDGNLLKTVSWNSLDPSSKFYSECVCSGNGKLIAEKDATGELAAEYEYVGETSVVNAVKYANGSKIAYGRNPLNDVLTSVTQSTGDGEANTTNITYKYGLPVKVSSGNTVFDYEYEAKGRKISVTVNGILQSTFNYGKYVKGNNYINYGTDKQTLKVDGKDVNVINDKVGHLDSSTGIYALQEKQTINGDVKYEKNYNIDGSLSNVAISGNSSVDYTYDSYKNLTQISGLGITELYTYNDLTQLTRKEIAGTVSHTYNYFYKNNAARSLDYITFNSFKIKPLADVNGRNTGKEIFSGSSKIAAEYISYRKVGDHATNMPSAIWYGNYSSIKDSIKYSYDKSGNISEITENGDLAVRYEYDALNRIIREDNKKLGKTTVFSYDSNGNILSRCEYPYTLRDSEELCGENCTHFDYAYKGDRLVNCNGESFAYNTLGSPVTYRGKSATWNYGKLLTSYNGVSFNYDVFGKRTSKGGIIFTYDHGGNLVKQSNGLEFVYDMNGLSGVKYNNTQYFYRKDSQGNIIAILDSFGAVVVKYIYDAWGNHAVLDANGNDVESGIGALNPYRYCGYYYDTETGFYYLKTRYYDPELGRFISQDSVEYADAETINGLNLYAYCNNNPVMAFDPTGKKSDYKWWEFWKWDWKGIASTAKGLVNPINKITAGASILIAVCQGRWDDLASDWGNGCFNPLNQKDSVALNAKVFSFYKGESVIRHNIKGATSSQIFGTIFLNVAEKNDLDGRITLHHEYGHSIQEAFLGLRYLTRVALPSFITYFTNVNSYEYYSMPWERTADFFGDVERSSGYKKGSLTWSFAELIFGWYSLPFYFGFGY